MAYTNKDAVWSKFAAGLLEYIESEQNGFLIKKDYEIHLEMCEKDILHELWHSNKINQLSPELKRVALEYLDYLDKKKENAVEKYREVLLDVEISTQE